MRQDLDTYYYLCVCVAAPLPFRLFLFDAAFLKPLTMWPVFRTVVIHPRLSSSGDFVYGTSSHSESLLGDDSVEDDPENRSVKSGGVTN